MENVKHTFNIQSCKPFQTLMNVSTYIHSLEKITNLKRVNPWTNYFVVSPVDLIQT